MDSGFLALLVAIIAAVPGTVSLIIRRKQTAAETEKLESETADRLTQAALVLVEPLKKRIVEQDAELVLKASLIIQKETELEKLRNVIIRLKERDIEKNAGIERLLHQFKSLNIAPVWEPKNGG